METLSKININGVRLFQTRNGMKKKDFCFTHRKGGKTVCFFRKKVVIFWPYPIYIIIWNIWKSDFDTLFELMNIRIINREWKLKSNIIINVHILYSRIVSLALPQMTNNLEYNILLWRRIYLYEAWRKAWENYS